MQVHLLRLLKSGVIDVTTVGTAVMSRAAHTRRANNTSSPARTAAACRMTLSATATTTVVTSLMSWSTCAARQHPPAPPQSSDVKMDTASPRARCATGTMTALTTATRRDAVSLRRFPQNYAMKNVFLTF